MEEKATARERQPDVESQPIERSGGVTFHGGQVTIKGDVVGRDKIVYGDEVRGDKVLGDEDNG